MKKTDPYTQEESTTNKRNQKFACRANQIAYNNMLKAKLVDKLKPTNDKLESNRFVLDLLLDTKNEIIVNKAIFDELGFEFGYVTHFENTSSTTIFAVYEFQYIFMHDGLIKVFKDG